MVIAWGIALGALLWYGDTVRDAVIAAMTGNSQLVSGTLVGVGGQVPGVTLSMKAVLTVFIVAFIVFFPTILTATAGTIGYAFGGSGDPIVAVAEVVTSKSPWTASWPSSVTRIWGVVSAWLPVGFVIIAGVNLVVARLTNVWIIPMYVFVSRILWSI